MTVEKHGLNCGMGWGPLLTWIFSQTHISIINAFSFLKDVLNSFFNFLYCKNILYDAYNTNVLISSVTDKASGQ